MAKITDRHLCKVEKDGALPVDSKLFGNITYAIKNGQMWIIDRNTGSQIEVDGKNVLRFAREQVAVARHHKLIEG